VTDGRVAVIDNRDVVIDSRDVTNEMDEIIDDSMLLSALQVKTSGILVHRIPVNVNCFQC